MLQQVRHLRIAAPAITEIEQLVVQISRRFSRDAREITVRSGTPLLAMARGAGLHTRRHIHGRRGGHRGSEQHAQRPYRVQQGADEFLSHARQKAFWSP